MSRHVTRTHSVDLDWLFGRGNWDCSTDLNYTCAKKCCVGRHFYERSVYHRATDLRNLILSEAVCNGVVQATFLPQYVLWRRKKATGCRWSTSIPLTVSEFEVYQTVYRKISQRRNPSPKMHVLKRCGSNTRRRYWNPAALPATSLLWTLRNRNFRTSRSMQKESRPLPKDPEFLLFTRKDTWKSFLSTQSCRTCTRKTEVHVFSDSVSCMRNQCSKR